MSDILEDFRDAMRRVGLAPPTAIEADGALHRFYVEGDRRCTQNGWYLLHLDGRTAGAFGNWKTGVRSTWAAGGQRKTNTRWDDIGTRIEAERARTKARRRADHEAHAADARTAWAAAKPADPAHPYLVAKSVRAHTLRQSANLLLVPLFDAYGLLWNVQRIQADGSKRFRPGRGGGLYCPIGDFTSPRTMLICEGFATGATLHEETGHAVLCAMNAGNLLSVATAARAAWPRVDLVIAADNDRHTQGNPGVTHATAAAKAAGARLAVPEFPDGEPGTDFNDLAAIRRTRSES